MSEVTESSATSSADNASPFPEIAFDRRCRGFAARLSQPPGRRSRSAFNSSGAYRACGMDRCEIKSHRLQQFQVQLGAGIFSEFDLPGIRAEAPEDELVPVFPGTDPAPGTFRSTSVEEVVISSTCCRSPIARPRAPVPWPRAIPGRRANRRWPRSAAGRGCRCPRGACSSLILPSTSFGRLCDQRTGNLVRRLALVDILSTSFQNFSGLPFAGSA